MSTRKPKPYAYDPREIQEAVIAELPKLIEFFHEDAYRKLAKEHKTTIERMRKTGVGSPTANTFRILLDAINADRATIAILREEVGELTIERDGLRAALVSSCRILEP